MHCAHLHQVGAASRLTMIIITLKAMPASTLFISGAIAGDATFAASPAMSGAFFFFEVSGRVSDKRRTGEGQSSGVLLMSSPPYLSVPASEDVVIAKALFMQHPASLRYAGAKLAVEKLLTPNYFICHDSCVE